MKISREEFKEMVELYNEIWEMYTNACEVLEEGYADKLIFSVWDWLTKNTDLYCEEMGSDLIREIHFSEGECPISWEIDENGMYYNLKYSDNLDEIYDKYLA